MAFRFAWPQFSQDFIDSTKELLESALNKGPRAPHICDHIHVKELHFGTHPPHLEVLEISDLSLNHHHQQHSNNSSNHHHQLKFRGMFRLQYAGDFHLVLQTQVQVNPVTQSHPLHSARSPLSMGSFLTSPYNTGILQASKPLILPLLLTLHSLHLDATVYISYSPQHGLTINFKNDPLKELKVGSSFDEVRSVREALEGEVRERVRAVLREHVPRVLHELSLSYLRGGGTAATGGSTQPTTTTNTLETTTSEQYYKTAYGSRSMPNLASHSQNSSAEDIPATDPPPEDVRSIKSSNTTSTTSKQKKRPGPIDTKRTKLVRDTESIHSAPITKPRIQQPPHSQPQSPQDEIVPEARPPIDAMSLDTFLFNHQHHHHNSLSMHHHLHHQQHHHFSTSILNTHSTRYSHFNRSHLRANTSHPSQHHDALPTQQARETMSSDGVVAQEGGVTRSAPTSPRPRPSEKVDPPVPVSALGASSSFDHQRQWSSQSTTSNRRTGMVIMRADLTLAPSMSAKVGKEREREERGGET